MKIRLSGIVPESIVDGVGIRMVVFVQGCPHRCKGCHNPQTHEFDGGFESDTDDVILQMLQNPLLDGVTLSGGEPFCQAEALVRIAQSAHENGLNVWTYSGYTYEELSEIASHNQNVKQLLKETDVLVDGRFLLEERSWSTRFRGSSNQRLIDVPESLQSNHVILFTE